MLIGHPIATIPSNPCVPTPCGPNSNCHTVNEVAVCSCLPNYIGRAPNCRPECMTNSECTRNLACVNERCIDPCIGTCGAYATCSVFNHQAVCRCQDQFTGDPFSACSPIPSKSRNLECQAFCSHFYSHLYYAYQKYSPNFQKKDAGHFIFIFRFYVSKMLAFLLPLPQKSPIFLTLPSIF